MEPLFDLTDNSKMFRAMDTHEISAGGRSMEDSIGDYLTHGIADTVVSAGVGLYNTGMALGQVIGIAGKDAQVDEADTINSLLGADAASFYGRHKVGVDVAGLVVGSLLPGLAGVRALRMLQTAGKVSTGMEAATGLRNADLVMNSGAVEAAKKFALETTTARPNWFSAPMIKAYGVGMKQQVLESLAFEAGTLATMNQNATLNPDDLGYFTAIGDQFWSATAFGIGGGVLGGAVEGLRIMGAVRKFGKEEWARTNSLAVIPTSAGYDNMVPGSKLMELSDIIAKRKDMEMEIAPNDWFAHKQFATGEAQVRTQLLDVFGQSNDAGQVGIDALHKLVDTAASGQVDQVATVLSGFQKFSINTADDMAKNLEFNTKTRAPIGMYIGQDATDIIGMVSEGQRDFMRAANKVITKEDSKLNLTVDKVGKAIGKTASSDVGGSVSGNSFKDAGSAVFNTKAVSLKGSQQDLVLIPDFISINTENLNTAYSANKKLHSAEAFDFTRDEFEQYAVLHELGHLKNNSYKARLLLDNTFDRMATRKLEERAARVSGEEVPILNVKESRSIGMVEDLISASIQQRGIAWENANPTLAGRSLKDKTASVMDAISHPQWRKQEFSYLGDPAELLADGAAFFTNPATREIASKQFPRLGKMFNKDGALAKAWSPTEAHYNVRTGEVNTSPLLGLNDIDDGLKHISNKGEQSLYSPVLKQTFNTNEKLFQKADVVSLLSKRQDYREYDAQWIMASQRKFADLAGENGVIHIADSDLPTMERVATLSAEDSLDGIGVKNALNEGKVFVGGQVVMPDALPQLVQSRKEEIRLLLAGSKVGYNELELSKILNIEVGNARGMSNASEDGWMLMGKKDYTKPENIKMNYSHKSIGDYQGAVMNSVGVSMLNDAVLAQNKLSTAALIGPLADKLPQVQADLMNTISPFSQRATMTSNLRPEMQSLREKAAYIGNQVGQYITNQVHKVNESFVNHVSKFNDASAGAARFELAQVDNILRREQYYLAETASGAHIVRKDAINNALDSMGIQFTPDMLQNIPDEIVAGMLGAGDKFAPDAIKLGDDVANFYRQHSITNAGLVGRKQELGKALGKTNTLDPNVLYSPPRDLSKQKYFAFVVPSIVKEGNDSRRFMIYGETQAEFEAKKLVIQQKYGKQYGVFTKEDTKEYAEAMKYHDEGNVFDELHFDSTVMSKGRSSELAPNVDMTVSNTLERYRSWTIKQEESLIRNGVELHYSDVSGQLKRMDNEVAKVENSTLSKRFQEPATIWADTLATMLNKRARGSTFETGWARVNDYMGKAGSEMVEKALGTLSKITDAPITQEGLNGFNKTLADNGFQSPFDKVAEVLLSSPETTGSSVFPAAVKTMSNLIGSLMLRLDAANSMIQLVSSPILSLAVLSEAKQALKGTEAGSRLHSATTILNPAAGKSEPSTMKLFANAATKFHSAEGKDFINELKDRNIISDHLSRYMQVMDMTQLNGRHTMTEVNQKIDTLAHYGSKVSMHNFSEEYTRFNIAMAVRDLCDIRGIPKDEQWSIISGAVDKTHGVYAGAQRPQLFNGVLGQSVGLFQTYFFNYAQNLLKYTADGNKKQAAIMLGMQSSIFGVQSLPGFSTLNSTIGNVSRDNKDFYSTTNADHPDSWSTYAMYGMASHMFGFPVDFATRGSLASRNMLVIPTQFQDLPIVGTIGKAVGNVIDTAQMLSNGDVTIGRALLHGMAHNALNRPLQGIAQIAMGDVDTANGQVQWTDANRIDHRWNEDLSWGSMFARAIGTRPLNETIVNNAYFRNAEYKANTDKELAEIGGKIQMNSVSGNLQPSSFGKFAAEYEAAGGEIQSFNAYWGRQLKKAGNGTMEKFQQDMKLEGGQLGRSRSYMEARQSTKLPWDLDGESEVN